MTDKVTTIKPQEPEPNLEIQNLILRKLHTEALQMLVVMGKNLISSRKVILDIQKQMQRDYAEFEAFMEVNAARLNTPSDDDNESRD